MKDYIKPTFTLAGLFPVAMASSGCNIPKDELENLEIIIGVDPTNKDVFTSAENCVDQYDIDLYCKFTSTEAGYLKILGS